MSAANINKFSWWIANLWDWWFPLSCWASNATWAMGDINDDPLERETVYGCNKNLEQPPYSCWCGKFCNHEAIRKFNAEMAAVRPDEGAARDPGFFGSNHVGREVDH